MTALILEPDERTRRTLAELVSDLGFSTVLAAGNTRRFKSLYLQFEAEIRLIFISGNPPPSTVTARRRAPLIQILDRSFIHRVSGADEILKRPFGPRELKRSVDWAFETHQKKRNEILLIGSGSSFRNIPLDGAGHWAKVRLLESPGQAVREMESHPENIGAVILDPVRCTSEFVEALGRFKRTELGRATPLAILSRHAQATLPFRRIGDLYFAKTEKNDSPEIWRMILQKLSRRSVQVEFARNAIRESRRHLKSGNLRQARILIREALSRDPWRWEFRELAGQLAERRGARAEAQEHFEIALHENPCSPSSYLSLLRLDDNPENCCELSRKSLEYCPRHPELLSLATRMEGDAR